MRSSPASVVYFVLRETPLNLWIGHDISSKLSICSSSSCSLDQQRSVVENLAHLDQPRAKVRSDNKLDPLNLGLSEHNPKVFSL